MSPTYNFRDIETGTEYSMSMKMDERQKYLDANPDIVQIIALPTLHSGRGLVGKIDNGFRDLLKEMKNQHSKGFWVSTINTDR